VTTTTSPGLESSTPPMAPTDVSRDRASP